MGFSSALNDSFEVQGYNAPDIVFAPQFTEMPCPELKDFFRACRAMERHDGRIRALDFDHEAVFNLRHFLIMLKVEEDGIAFRYSHYGQGIAEFRGLNMVGRRSDYFSGHVGRFFTALYQAVFQRQQWVMSIHEPPKRIFVSQWRRLIVPLFDESGTQVVEIAVLNVPYNELCSGFNAVPDPLLIADEDMMLRFANRAACAMFGAELQFGASLDLSEFAGIRVDIPETPSLLANRGAVRDLACMTVRGSVIQRFFLTISGLNMNRRAFYLIGLRPVIEDIGCGYS